LLLIAITVQPVSFRISDSIRLLSASLPVHLVIEDIETFRQYQYFLAFQDIEDRVRTHRRVRHHKVGTRPVQGVDVLFVGGTADDLHIGTESWRQ
jgi:hypothetical protein